MDPECTRGPQGQGSSGPKIRTDLQKSIPEQHNSTKNCTNIDSQYGSKGDVYGNNNGQTGQLVCADIKNATSAKTSIDNTNKTSTKPACTQLVNPSMATSSKPNTSLGNTNTAPTYKHVPSATVARAGIPNTKIADSRVTNTYCTSTSSAGTIAAATTTDTYTYVACTTGRFSAEDEAFRKKAVQRMDAQYEFVRALALINIKKSGGLLYKNKPSPNSTYEEPLRAVDLLRKAKGSTDLTNVHVYEGTPSSKGVASYDKSQSEIACHEVPPSSRSRQIMKQFKAVSRGVDAERFEAIMKAAIEEAENYPMPNVVYLSEDRCVNAESFVDAVDRTLWTMIFEMGSQDEDTPRKVHPLINEQAAMNHPEGGRNEVDITLLEEMTRVRGEQNRRHGPARDHGDTTEKALNLDTNKDCHSSPLNDTCRRQKQCQGNNDVHECLMTTIRGIMADHGFLRSSKNVRSFDSLDRCENAPTVTNNSKVKAHPKANKYKVEPDPSVETKVESTREKLEHL